MIDSLPWVGLAALGALGALGRFTVDGAVSGRWPSDFPFGTLAVNLSGSFALGVLVGLGLTGDARLVLGTGLLGAYTTFSTWMVEAQRLGEDGEWRLMWLNLAGPMVAGLAITGVGWIVGGALA
jgi:fluoride exporter